MAKTSRKRRKERRRAAGGGVASGRVDQPSTSDRGVSAEAPALERGYARGRARDEAARAALQPLAPGERPGAVTAGALVVGLLALANLIATAFGWDGGTDADEAQRLIGSVFVTVLLIVVTVGLWRARYWAVLGLQTLLAIAIIFASLGLVTATSWWAAVLLVLIIAGAGTLFWFMVKAMARIQMPERPGASSRR